MSEKKTEKQKREERLAENLRANLRRRKAAARKSVTIQNTALDNELRARMITFLVVFLVEMSRADHHRMPPRSAFDPKIIGFPIRYNGLSNHDWLLGIFQEIGVVSKDEKPLFDAEAIYEKFIDDPHSEKLTNEYIFECFFDLCGNYGPAIPMETREWFKIPKTCTDVFQSLVVNGFLEEKDKAYRWKEKVMSFPYPKLVLTRS